MDRPTDALPSIDRRAFLGSAAALAVTTPAAAARAVGQDASSLSVLTWNVYLGVDLSGLTGVSSMGELRQEAGDLLEEAEAHPYEERTDAIAAEIETADPDVVALQEAARITRRDPDADEETEVADVLNLIVSALGERGRDYDVAVSAVSTDVEITGETDDGEVDVGLTDRDVLLVRSDLETGETESGKYAARLIYPLPTFDVIALERSYCTATVTTEGGDVTVVCTHLESSDADVRQRQAEELLDVAPSEGPVVLAGDFNSGPGTTTGAYDRLTETFADAYAARRPDADGNTCCQAASLRNDSSRLSERVDGLLYRGGPDPSAADRVAADSGDRFELETDDGTVEMWPSDHAGVRATFELPNASTPTDTDAETATTTPTATATPTATDAPVSAATTGTSTTTVSATAGTEEGAETGTTTRAATDAGSSSSPSTENRATDEGTAGSGDTGPRRAVTADEGPGLGFLTAVTGVAGGLFARWRRE